MFSTTINSDEQPSTTSRATSSFPLWSKLQPIMEVEEVDVNSLSSVSRDWSEMNGRSSLTAADTLSATSNDTYRTATGSIPLIYGAFDLSSVSSIDRLSYRTADEGDLSDFEENFELHNGSMRPKKKRTSVTQNGAISSGQMLKDCPCHVGAEYAQAFTFRIKAAIFGIPVVLLILFLWAIGLLIIDYGEKLTFRQDIRFVSTNQNDLPFPSVYICPIGTSSEWVRNPGMNISDELWQQITRFPPVSGDNISDFTPKSLQNYFLSAGLSVGTLFRKCKFGKTDQNCSKIVRPVFDLKFGKCFWINTTGIRQEFPGEGLNLLLSAFHGIIFLEISEHFQIPSTNMFLIEPQKISSFNLRAIKYDFASKNCVSNGNMQLKVLEVAYTPESCKLDCTFAQVVEECNCLPLIDEKFLRKEIGMLRQRGFLFCYETNETENCANSNKGAAEIEKCRQKCLPACSFWKYQSDMSSSSELLYYMTNEYGFNEDLSNGNSTGNKPQKSSYESTENVSLVAISFSDLQYINFIQVSDVSLSDGIYDPLNFEF